MLARFLILLLITFTGCTHRVEVHPLPSNQAPATISRSLQVVVVAPTLEGADHRPGITLLKWPQEDLLQAVIRYLQLRGTFSSVLTNPTKLRLRVTTKLALSSRQGRYHYHIRLQGEVSEEGQVIKTYLAEATAAGSRARWVTASDRDPIESALQLALDDLCTKLEGDRSLYAVDTAGTPIP
jgi:hypothetical protein